METLKTIVIISSKKFWEQAQQAGEYNQSTLTSTLEEVGFIHCSFPNQTMEIANRRYAHIIDALLLFVDTAKVKPVIKYESALSGREGVFPHVYGPLNVDAVYATAPLERDSDGVFIAPAQLKALLALETDGI